MKKLVISLFLLLGAFQTTFSSSIESAPYLFDFQNYEHNPNVRPYTSEDYNQVSAVLNENYLGFGLGYEGYATLVYEKNGIIQGVCIFEFATGYVELLAVGKAYQGQGVGKALLVAAVSFLSKEHNPQSVELYSLPDAKPFYQKAGFKFEGQWGSLQLS